MTAILDRPLSPHSDELARMRKRPVPGEGRPRQGALLDAIDQLRSRTGVSEESNRDHYAHSWVLYEVFMPRLPELMMSLQRDSLPFGVPVDYVLGDR